MRNSFKKVHFLLFFFLVINLFLNIYGNKWGLPSRWNADEKVVNVLHMGAQKVLYDPYGAFFHPTGYHIFLLLAFIPAYIFLKIIGYPFVELKEAASISWIHMSYLYPDFASGIYIYARTLSALLGTLTVYFIYLIGKNLYDKKTGLFSAAFLSVCMGFISVNHFAKYISLVNMMIVLTIFFCLKAFHKKDSPSVTKYIFLSFFIGGISASVHINAPLLLLPLGVTLVFSYSSLAQILKKSWPCVFFYVSGIFVGTPSLLSKWRNYFLIISPQYQNDLGMGNGSLEGLKLVFVKMLNYFFETLSLCGIPLFILVVIGFFYMIFHWKKISKAEFIVFSFPLSYLLIMSIFYSDVDPQSKNVIAATPFLMIFAGRLMSKCFNSQKVYGSLKYALFSGIFVFSFVYCLKADLVFKYDDTRYASTKWILENIPKGSTLEVFDQLNYMASTTIFHDYEIVYLGRSSKTSSSKHFFNWSEVEKRNEYLTYINQYDSSSDYIVLSASYDLSKNHIEGIGHVPGVTQYMSALLENKKHYRLVKVFEPTNKRIQSQAIKGVVHYRDLFWNPIPSYRDVYGIIYIFKKIE